MRTHAPHTYDEITRQTVPEPDSSFRPPLPPDAPNVIDLRARVAETLQSLGAYDIGYEVEGARAMLRGEARDAETRDWIVRCVAAIDGIEGVDSTIRLR